MIMLPITPPSPLTSPSHLQYHLVVFVHHRVHSVIGLPAFDPDRLRNLVRLIPCQAAPIYELSLPMIPVLFSLPQGEEGSFSLGGLPLKPDLSLKLPKGGGFARVSLCLCRRDDCPWSRFLFIRAQYLPNVIHKT